MTAITKSLAPEFVLCWILAFAPAVSPQSPAQPGKLHITSTPTGAKIMVNGDTRPEVTPITLVVSPGKYTVQVGDCQPQNDVSVSSGNTTEVHCP
jgi:PEGA domain